MSPAQRRYLIEQAVGSCVVNLPLNAVIAWLLFRGLPIVPLFGPQSIAGDTVGTSLILPFLTCLIVTRLARRELRHGRVAAPGWTRATHPVLAWVPRGTLARALLFALVGVLTFAPLTIVALDKLGVESMSFWGFITFKACFAAFAGLFVSPLCAACAIAEPPA
jgi:hypothetical protein